VWVRGAEVFCRIKSLSLIKQPWFRLPQYALMGYRLGEQFPLGSVIDGDHGGVRKPTFHRDGVELLGGLVCLA
jgi:hypothetical protein